VKIRSQLLLVMVIALFITISLVASVQMYTTYYQAHESMKRILQHQANQFSGQVETWFGMIQQNGHFFVSQTFVQNATQPEMQKLLGNLHNEINVFNNLIIAKPDGTITNIYPFNQTIIGTNIIQSAYFKDTIALQTPQISKVITNSETGKISIVITQPIITSNNELIGVLLQDINLNLLQDMVQDAVIGHTGQTIIFDNDKQILSSQNGHPHLFTNVPASLSDFLNRDLHDITEFSTDNGQNIIAATNRIREPSWGVAVTITQSEILQSFYDSAKYGGFTFVIIFILLTFIASLIFNRLFGSITVITEQLASINDGNFLSAKINKKLIQSAPQELQQLCTTFNTMSETITQNIEMINEANEALILSEERWQLALNGSNDGIWDWNIQTNEIFFSSRVKQMFGYATTNLSWTMEDWQKRLHPDDSEMVQTLLKDHLEQKSAYFSAEFRFLCSDNNFKWACIRGQGVWNYLNIPVRIVGSISDISKRKKAEEELHNAHDQLELKIELRTQDLVAMNQELQQTLENLRETQDQLVQSEKMASLGNLVAGIAHEINTPIGIGVTAASHLEKITKEFITTYETGTLKRLDLTNYLADSGEAVTIIFSNLERASQLVRSFKQVSVDQSSEARREFNVRQYLGELLLSLQPKLKRTNHNITIHCDENLKIDSFPGAFAQILTNLIMNSIVHAYEADVAGQITIDIEKRNNYTLCLTYKDDGKGMDTTILNKIYNPFFTTKRGKGGTGLGLYIVYNIITQQFGGSIECISRLGKGTKFLLEFPLEKEIGYDN